VLTPEIARLVEPRPDLLADAIVELIENPTERARLGDVARRVAGEKYSRDSYLRRTAQAYARLGAPDAPDAPVAPDAPAQKEFARQ
jgi:glycosyltransferase involved in cell wall biosynthesis